MYDLGTLMTDESVLRQAMLVPPDRVLARLPAMGKVMVVVQDGGVTHERIGVVERIAMADGCVAVTGAAHDCVLDPARIASVVADRSGRMKDKVLPKLEFLDAEDNLVFSVVGLDGIAGFDEALGHFPAEPRNARAKPAGQQAVLAADDPGSQPFAAARGAETEIAVAMSKAGLIQRWRGFVPAINPAMGFINIIAPDFHLHIRGGTVASWERAAADAVGEVRLAALDGEGRPVGLTLQGPRGAFEPA
jgi:putative heme degradation protein